MTETAILFGIWSVGISVMAFVTGRWSKTRECDEKIRLSECEHRETLRERVMRAKHEAVSAERQAESAKRRRSELHNAA